MKRVRVVINGDVQGVGFRVWLKKHARTRGVTGWVKNRDDGTVEAVFEGEDDKIKEMIELCYSGPEVAWVEDVQVVKEPYVDEFIHFEIIEE
jgi:acylphosphatase